MTNPEVSLGRLTGLMVRLRRCLHPAHEPPRIGGIRPDDGDLGVHEPKAEEDFLRRGGIVQIGRGDHNQQGQPACVHDQVTLPTFILSSPILQVPDLECCMVDGVLDGLVSRGCPATTTSRVLASMTTWWLVE